MHDVGTTASYNSMTEERPENVNGCRQPLPHTHGWPEHTLLYSSQRSSLLSALPTWHLPPLSSLLSSEVFLRAVLTYINNTDCFRMLYAAVTENRGGAVKQQTAENAGGAAKR